MENSTHVQQHKSHIAWFLVTAWGHITSANALLAKMLQLNEALVITVVHHKQSGSKAKQDLSRYPGLPWDRLNIVEVGDLEINGHPYETMKIVMQQYVDGWIQTLKHLNSSESSWPKPTALILDQYGANQSLPEARRICQPNIKTYMHWTPSITCLHWLMAPSALGGIADFEELTDKIYQDESRRNNRTREEIMGAIFQASNGTDTLSGQVVHVPGVKDMYDYERMSSNTPSPAAIWMMLGEMSKLIRNTDGVVTAASDAMEAAAIAECNEIYPVFPCGIQVSPRGWGKGAEIENDPGLTEFLGRFQQNEVLFISFGSVHFPSNAVPHIAILVDVLIQERQPFVFALGGPSTVATMGEELVERIKSSDVGYACTSWVDQQAILQHPNLGWFLSHGGWNSICESVVQGVPLIFWPVVIGDQALNSAMLSTRDEPVAFELMQIRQGVASAPAKRGGDKIIGDDESVRREFLSTIKKMKGPEGNVLRANVQKLAAELAEEKVEKENTVIRELAYR